MNEYEEIKIEPEKVTVDEISQELYHVAGNEKFKLLLGVLKKEEFENAIIFCNTKYKAVEVAKRLEVNGYKTNVLMGDLPQKKRLEVINRMKAGELDILVATDVAARGLHVDDLSVVVNYDLPEDYENYVHRIGRTARAGKSGRAVSLACEKYVFHLEAIESFIKDKIKVMIADETMFGEDASKGMRFKNEYEDDRPGRGRDDSRSSSRGRPGGGRRGGGRPSERGKPQDRSRSDRDSRTRERTPAAASPGRGSGGSRGGNRGGGSKKRPAGDNQQRNRQDNRNRAGGRDRKPVDIKKPGVNAGVEERLAYYKAKYGEDFKPSESMLKQEGRPKESKKKNGEAGNKGILGKFFGKKK
jgi:ATP-dependent RNA helicase RhlB